MHKLEPIAISIESDNVYKVRFKSDSGEVEYKFTAHDDGLLSVGCEVDFAKITNGDPAVPLLTKAIASSHQARHFRYEKA